MIPIRLAAAACAAFVAVSRYVSVTPLLLALRNGHRVSLIPAINLANVSEFSIVIAAVGLKAGHISQTAQTLIVIVFAVTATVSTYKISYNFELQRLLSRWLKRIGVRDLDQMEQRAAAVRPRLMLLGFAKVASSLLEEIERRAPALKERMAVVDFNPEAVHELRRRGINVHYGDISHTDSLRHAGIEEAEIVVSTIPDHYLKGIANRHILQLVRQLNPKALVVVTAETLASARELYAAGADYVSLPRLNTAADLLPALEKLVAGVTDSDREAFQAAAKHRHEIIP